MLETVQEIVPCTVVSGNLAFLPVRYLLVPPPFQNSWITAPLVYQLRAAIIITGFVEHLQCDFDYKLLTIYSTRPKHSQY